MFHIGDVEFDEEITEYIETACTGVIGAMESEVSLLRDRMVIEKTERISGMLFWQGSLNGHPLVLVQCGAGKVNAAICAQTLILRFGVGRIINTGVAGSLHNAIEIGDIVISTDAVQHDLDACSIGFEKGEIPFHGLRFFPADAELRERAVQAARKAAPETQVFEGRVCSGDQFIAGMEQKRAIIDEFGGYCCEMEGAAIAQVCALSGVPFVIIRAISDKADESGEVSFEAFAAEAARRSAAIVSELLGSF